MTLHTSRALARLAPVAGTLLLTALLPLGCGSDDDATPTASAATTATSSGAGGQGGEGSGGASGTGGGAFETAPHTAFPELTGDMAFTIPALHLVSMVYPGYEFEQEVKAFGDVLVTSSWLASVVSEYGIQNGTHEAIVLPNAAPAVFSDGELVALIEQEVANGLLPPPGDPTNTLYMLYLPAGMTFDDGEGYYACQDYFGYHYQVEGVAGTINYTVVGNCTDALEDVTATSAHEYVETATDPGPVGGYWLDVPDTDPWYTLWGLENADLCDYAPYHVEGGFSFQRSWSNALAKAAQSSPCAPIPDGEVFFDVSASPADIPEVDAGASATFTLTGWSTAPVADFDLSVSPDWGEFDLVYELDRTTLNNGLTATLTLTVPPGTPSGSFGAAMVYAGDGEWRYWPVAVWVK
jgi:hypothetical protein